MPLYDYRCSEGHTFESRQPVDTAELECTVCGSPAKRAFLQAPVWIMRPPGYSLRPGEKGYDKLPKTDKTYNRAQWTHSQKEKGTVNAS